MNKTIALRINIDKLPSNNDSKYILDSSKKNLLRLKRAYKAGKIDGEDIYNLANCMPKYDHDGQEQLDGYQILRIMQILESDYVREGSQTV